MCALYFNTNTRKIYSLLESGNTIIFKGKEVVLKREIITFCAEIYVIFYPSAKAKPFFGCF